MSLRETSDGHGAARTAAALIWERQRADTLARVGVLESAVAALAQHRLPDVQRRAAEREAHRLAGAAGTFGFHRASEAARRLERVFAGSLAVSVAETCAAADAVVELRAGLDGEAAPGPARAGSTGAESRHPESIAVGGARATVLVLTTDVVVLEAVRTVLGTAGLRTVGLEDPAALRAALPEARPDLVLLDLDLDGRQGGEPLRTARGEACGRGVPVLLLSAGGDAGAADVLAKPFTGPELLARVRQQLDLPHPTRPAPSEPEHAD